MNFNSLPDIPPHPSKASKVLTGKEAIARYKRYKHSQPQGANRFLVILSKQIGSRYFNALYVFDKHRPGGAMLSEFEYRNESDLKEGLPHVKLLGEITQRVLNAAMETGETFNPFAN
ncbi:hypothetical protein N9B65_00370 [Akkermansiaceae bacterium]|nr:hypothetical protein [Akkermansiaceae bacterium]